MPDSGATANLILDKLRSLASQLANAVTNKDEKRIETVCAQMNSLVDVLEALAVPDAASGLVRLRRHIRFPEIYAARQEWEKIRSDPADCLTDIDTLRSKVAATGTPSEPWWLTIHPSVRGVSESRYNAGHRADAVEAALKEVNSRVQKEYMKRSGIELDGKGLMTTAFGKGRYQIVLANLKTVSGRNEQEGYMLLFAGAMQGLRNPKAHANLDIDENRAQHHLVVASLLMFKLDEAKVPT